MRSKQIRGPFAAHSTLIVRLENTKRIKQIGVEKRHSTPIGRYYLNDDSDVAIHLTIDGVEVALCDNDIVEYYGDLYNGKNKVTLGFPQYLDEYIIIDINYIDIDDEE